MDNKIRINIQVGESRYPLWVDRDEEPFFRQAARIINSRLIAYRTKYRGANLPPEAIMAMAAIDLAVSSQKQAFTAGSAESLKALSDVVADLQQFVATTEE